MGYPSRADGQARRVEEAQPGQADRQPAVETQSAGSSLLLDWKRERQKRNAVSLPLIEQARRPFRSFWPLESIEHPAHGATRTPLFPVGSGLGRATGQSRFWSASLCRTEGRILWLTEIGASTACNRPIWQNATGSRNQCRLAARTVRTTLCRVMGLGSKVATAPRMDIRWTKTHEMEKAV